MGNFFKGGGDGAGPHDGDRTRDGGDPLDESTRRARQSWMDEFMSEMPEKKDVRDKKDSTQPEKEVSTTPKNPIKKVFDDVSHLSLEVIPALSQKLIDKLQPAGQEQAEKQLKETDEKPQDKPKENIFESVVIRAMAKSGLPAAKEAVDMMDKAGPNKDLRTIIKESFTTMYKDLIDFTANPFGLKKLQEVPESGNGSIAATNKTAFGNKLLNDTKSSAAITKVQEFTGGKTQEELRSEIKSTSRHYDPGPEMYDGPAITQEIAALVRAGKLDLNDIPDLLKQRENQSEATFNDNPDDLPPKQFSNADENIPPGQNLVEQHDDGSVLLKINEPTEQLQDAQEHPVDKPFTHSAEGWLEAAQKIAQLPFDKQLQVIGAGLSAGVNESAQQFLKLWTTRAVYRPTGR